MRICKEQPADWDGKHLLQCKHLLNSKSKIRYLMYCNHLGYTKSGKIKLLVFGERYTHTRGGRVRYIDDESRVYEANDFNVAKEY
jgi:hypothetical protein|nr:MAG TPA: hypothetical protein [Caudoviricetes sp.]